MQTFTLMEHTTIRGTNNTVTQSESQWLDLFGYQDLIAYVQTFEVTGLPTATTLNIQTSPTRDDSLFQTAATIATVSVSTQVLKAILSTNPAVPLMRWVRWQLTSTATPFDVNMRIFVSANSISGRGAGRAMNFDSRDLIYNLGGVDVGGLGVSRADECCVCTCTPTSGKPFCGPGPDTDYLVDPMTVLRAQLARRRR